MFLQQKEAPSARSVPTPTFSELSHPVITKPIMKHNIPVMDSVARSLGVHLVKHDRLLLTFHAFTMQQFASILKQYVYFQLDDQDASLALFMCL